MANDKKHYQDQEVIEPGDRRYKDDDYFRNQHDRDARDPYYNEDMDGGRRIYVQRYGGCGGTGCMSGCLFSIIISILLTFILNFFLHFI